MRIISAFAFLILVFITAKTFAATEFTIRGGAPVVISPGIDVNRQIVATLVLNSDQPYSVSISDDNGGTLNNGKALIPYRISYNNNAEINMSPVPATVETAASISNGESTIAVSILGSDTTTALAGDYSATITVTVTSF